MTLFLSILLFFSAPKAEDLSLKLEKGEVYSQTTSSNVIMVQTINGAEQKINMEVNGSINYEVAGIEGSTYLMDVYYTSLSMTMESPMGSMSFSSANEDTGDLFSTFMKEMVNKNFQLKMSKSGTISDVKGLENVFSSMFNAFPDIPEAQKQQILGQIKNAYGEKALKGNIEMLTAIYPEEKVSEGESWSNSVSLEAGISGTLDNKFTYQGITDQQRIIKGISTITTKDKDAYVPVNGMPTKYNLSGKMTSSFRLDPDTNWIAGATIEQEMSGDIQIKDNPNLPGGMTIPMTMTQTMTVTE